MTLEGLWNFEGKGGVESPPPRYTTAQQVPMLEKDLHPLITVNYYNAFITERFLQTTQNHKPPPF